MKVLLALLATFLGLALSVDPVQHYGYITVNQAKNANLFYWMFENPSNSTDLILWLNGGPGCSSMVGLFFENGPYKINPSTLQLKPNPYGWHNAANILYVDQPAGTGFSYANSDYIANETMVGEEMFTFLTKFFQKYPQYAHMNFFIMGESYAGKYIPSIAVKIIAENAKKQTINLKGIAMGDGITDTKLIVKSWAPFLAAKGLITYDQCNQIQTNYYAACANDIDNGDYSDAFFDCNQVLQACLMDAGNINPYDVRQPCSYPPLCYDTSYIANYLNLPSVQKTLGVNKQWVACDTNVYAPFETKDFDYDYSYEIPIALSKIPVLVYNGDQDLIVDFFGQSETLASLNWSGQSGFNRAPNVTWHVNGKRAGTSRTYQGLTFLVVEGAGHMVPYDVPTNALDMTRRFLKGLPFN